LKLRQDGSDRQMVLSGEQAILDFYTYPPIGGEDWRYAFQTAQVRALETQMLSRAAMTEMASAASYEDAVGLLAATEYALPQRTAGMGEINKHLLEQRAALYAMFEQWCLDKEVIVLFRSRYDFANLRLALRRSLTGRAVGTDYSDSGNVAPERFAEVLEQEEYRPLPDFLQDAANRAVLAYYQDKDIRRIDHAIDAAQAQYNLQQARRLGSEFLVGLFRIQIDLTNIRTMLRLKFSGSELRNVFLEGGYLEVERLQGGLDMPYESLAQLFYVTPYHRLVESAAAYLASERSFLKLEQQCDQHLAGYLQTTVRIASGLQPIIAYLLMKENEIRTIRFILTGKKNRLESRLILDRIG